MWLDIPFLWTFLVYLSSVVEDRISGWLAASVTVVADRKLALDAWLLTVQYQSASLYHYDSAEKVKI